VSGFNGFGSRKFAGMLVNLRSRLIVGGMYLPNDKQKLTNYLKERGASEDKISTVSDLPGYREEIERVGANTDLSTSTAS
jgi:hypothetical protein